MIDLWSVVGIIGAGAAGFALVEQIRTHLVLRRWESELDATISVLENEPDGMSSPGTETWPDKPPSLDLTKEQRDELVVLIRQEFRDELDRSGRKQFWLSLGQSAFFFVLGVVVTLILS